MPINTLTLVLEIIHFFEANEFILWLFGGWAEELWQIAPPRSHRDIDFLYPADSFQKLDQLIAENDFQEIRSKRFSHKRAIIYQNVMIEFLLIQRDHRTYFTDFFSGQYHHKWPPDLLWQKRTFSGHDLQLASQQALLLYRQSHKYIEEAYQAFLQSRTAVSP